MGGRRLAVLTGLLLAAGAAAGADGRAGVRPVSFLLDVEPILTRRGCNQGACHGAQHGKGGFRLSLAAYDPDFDYGSILRHAGGRRVDRVRPENSLLLRKPALQAAHVGGLRLERGSRDFQTLARWMAAGAPGPNAADPRLERLEVMPTRASARPGGTLAIRVAAVYSTGWRRDVTAHSRFTALAESVARVDDSGRVRVARPGWGPVMVRYGGLAACVQIDVPRERGQTSQALHPSSNPLDLLVARRWRDLGLRPAGLCTDAEFLRRASLDLIGTLPAPAEVRAFLADRSPDRRVRLVDRLLSRPEYADYWSQRWADLLRLNGASLGARPLQSYAAWLRAAFAANMPFDRMVRELLTAQGRASESGPANYFRTAASPGEMAETTSQLFLGIRLQCARCHQHPFEKWSQRDYYQLAAFFARVQVRPAGRDALVRASAQGEAAHPKTGERMIPVALRLDGGPPPRPAPEGIDRREALAAWLTAPDNRQFARTLVNRVWAHLMGRGIVDPVDDMRVTNPPSNPALLDALADGFVRGGYDLKRLLRAICVSRVYQLSARHPDAARADAAFFTHRAPRRQPAEVLLDSIARACGADEKFPGLPAGTRAIQLPDSGIASPFLDTFGRPPRATSCECERSPEPNLSQALQLLTGDVVNRLVAAPAGRAARLAASGMPEAAVVEELWLATLSRPPTPAESRLAVAAVRRSQNRRQAVEDLLWALLNRREFVLIR